MGHTVIKPVWVYEHIELEKKATLLHATLGQLMICMRPFSTLWLLDVKGHHRFTMISIVCIQQMMFSCEITNSFLSGSIHVSSGANNSKAHNYLVLRLCVVSTWHSQHCRDPHSFCIWLMHSPKGGWDSNTKGTLNPKWYLMLFYHHWFTIYIFGERFWIIEKVGSTSFSVLLYTFLHI